MGENKAVELDSAMEYAQRGLSVIGDGFLHPIHRRYQLKTLDHNTSVPSRSYIQPRESSHEALEIWLRPAILQGIWG